MFKAAESRTAPEVVEAAYYAMRALERRLGPKELARTPLLKGLASEPGQAEQELAGRWLQEIEEREHSPIGQFDVRTIERYLGELSETVQQRYRGERKLDPARGVELLQALRADSDL